MQKELSFNNWRLIVNLQGGRVEKLLYEDTLILGTFKRLDGKIGNTHVCVPNFVAEGTVEYGLPQHGFPRNMSWEVKTEDRTYLSIYCNVPATDLYKADLYVEQIFELSKNGFKQTIIVENTKGKAVPVNIAIHNYWATAAGWRSGRLNGSDITQDVQVESIRKARKSNTVVFSDGRSYRLKLRDLQDIKLWTAFNDKKEFNDDFVCIEPVMSLKKNYFGSKKSLLKEGKAIGVSQEIMNLV